MDLHKKVETKQASLIMIGILAIVLIGIKLVSYTAFNVEKEQEIAETYYYNGQYDKAVEQYEKIAEKDKLNPIWYAKVGETYSVKGDIENSSEYIKKVKEYEEVDADAYNYVVFTEYMNGEIEQAIVDGEEALKKYPGDRKLVKTMFLVYMTNNEEDKAKELVQAYPVDKESSYDAAEYSRMLILIGEREKGYEELRKAWSIDKDEYKIYDVLAQIATHDKDLVLREIMENAEKHPEDIAYKMWLAKIYSLSKDTCDEAEKMLNELQGKDVGELQLSFLEVGIMQLKGENDEADKLMNDIIEKYTNDYRVYHIASLYNLQKNNLEAAEEYSKKSIEANKDYPDNYGFLMPEILKLKEDRSGAESYFRRAIMLEPYNFNVMINIAEYWYTVGSTEKAIEYYKYAGILKSDDPEIKYSMVLMHIGNGQVYSQSKNQHLQNKESHLKKKEEYSKDEKNDLAKKEEEAAKKEEELAKEQEKLADEEERLAIELLKECIKLTENEGIPKYHRTLGTIYMFQGNGEEAIKEIRFAYRADEGDVLTLNNAGCYYISMGNDVDRGYANLLAAFEGLNDSYDQEVIDAITENFEKGHEINVKYYNGKDNEILQTPEFVLFY